MSVEIFQSSEWFAHLWRHGFETAPHRCWSWEIKTPDNSFSVRIPLVQGASGQGLSSLSNYYSCLFGPESDECITLLPDENQWDLGIKLLRSIPESHALRLQPLDAQSPWMGSLERNLQRNGFWTRSVFCSANWYQTVPAEGFKKYWAERPSALANTVRRGKRRLGAAGEWRIDLHSGSGNAQDLEKAVRAYEEVYANSWKQPEPCRAFMPGLVQLAAQKGWLRLGVLWLNSVPLAAQLWLTTPLKANIYKLAYAKGCEKFSAGSILTAAMMEHAMDVDKVAEVDYLSGDDGYKADWMEKRRERTELIAIDMKKVAGWVWAANAISKSGSHALKKKFLKS